MQAQQRDVRTELVRFLHALRCLVEGRTELYGVEFDPKLWKIRESEGAWYDCPWSEQRGAGVTHPDVGPCRSCGAGRSSSS